MARRVNSKFLIIFSAVTLLGVAAIFVVAGPMQNLFKGDRSKKQIAEGERFVAEADAAPTNAQKKEKLEAAARAYQQATASDAKNLELFVKLGDVYNRLTKHDVNSYIEASRKSWERALEVDPSYLPALRRLEDSYYQETQINPVAAYFTRLEEKSAAIHQLKPDDLKAHARLLISPLNQWLANIGTADVKVESSIAQLTDLIKKYPTAPEIGDMVFYTAGAQVRKALELRKTSQDQQGGNLIAGAIQLFRDSLQANDKDANLHYRFFELLTILAKDEQDSTKRQAYVAAQREQLQRARELVKKDDGQLFVKVNIAAHQLELQDRHVDRAEQVLLELQKERPNDQRVRLALAKIMRGDPKRLNEAITLLEQPIEDPGFEGVEAKLKNELEIQTWNELANMYVERYQTLKEAERPDELARIEQMYQKIHARVFDRSYVLKLAGKIQLLRGGSDAAIKAIDTFERAQAQFRVERNGQEDLDLVFLLAKAYFASHQTTQAKQQLIKFKSKMPDVLQVRLMLAQVLIAEGDTAAARDDVQYLEQSQPDAPEVLRLVLATLRPEEGEKAKAVFAKLPEETRGDKLLKAQIAPLPPVNSPDEATRLFKAVLAADPGDFDAAQGMKEVLLRGGKKAEAIELLKAGKAAKPEERRFDLVIAELEGADDSKLAGLAIPIITEQFKDPLTRELKLHEFELYGRKPQTAESREAAFKHLLAAEQIKPDDVRVMDLLFQHYLSKQAWDKAEDYARRLGEKNADQAGGLIYKFRVAMARQNLDAANQAATELTNKLPYFARSWVMRGQALQASGQYDLAISNGFGMALDKQSENPEALAGIIACYFQTGRIAEMGKYVEIAHNAHPSNAYFREQWIDYKLRYGNPAEVLSTLQAERDAKPDDRNRWVALGRAQYAAAGKKDKDFPKYLADAKATFNEAMKRFPDERRSYVFLAELSLLENKPADAEKLLKDMAARPEFRETPEALMILADHYLKSNKGEQAIATMRQAIDQFKDKPEQQTDVKRKLAAYYTQAGKYKDALDLLDAASPNPVVLQQVVEVYMLAGAASKEKGDSKFFKDAEHLLHTLLQKSPNDAQLNALLGVVLLNMGNEASAVESMNAALALDPKNQAALYSRAQVRLKAKPPQLDAALTDLVALRESNPAHVEARASLGEVYRLKNQLDLAARELQEAVRLAPGRRDLRMTLAGLYAGARPPQWSEAEQVIQEGQRIEPSDPMWQRMLSKMYSVKGQHEKAALAIREAIALDAKNAENNKDYKKNGELVKDYFDVLEAGKMWDQLLAETNGLMAQDPKQSERLWWLWVKRATASRNKGDTQSAMNDFQKALDIVQADKDVNQDVLIAIIDKIKENLGAPAAIARVQALIGKEQKDKNAEQAARWKIVLAYLYFQNKETAKANQTITQAIEDCNALDPAIRDKNLISALNVAGTLYMMDEEGKQFELARDAYTRLVDLKVRLGRDGEDLGALNNLACISAEHTSPPDMKKAVDFSERALAEMKRRQIQEPNVLDTYGWVQVLQGGAGVDKGIDKLQESLNSGTEIPEAHYHLGEAYLLKGLPQAAKRSLDTAARMIYDKRERREVFDENLKRRIDDALVRAEKALLKQ